MQTECASRIRREGVVNQQPWSWRRRARFTTILVFSLALQAGQAARAADPCDVFKGHVADQYRRDQLINQQLLSQAKDQLSNAMDCLQRVKRIMVMVTVPSIPDFVDMTIEQVLTYLANKACQVVVKTVDTKVVDPLNGAIGDINSLTREYNDYIERGADSINTNVGGPVVTTTGGGQVNVGGGGGGPASPSSAAPSNAAPTNAAPTSGGGTWNMLSCAFGAGANCRK